MMMFSSRHLCCAVFCLFTLQVLSQQKTTYQFPENFNQAYNFHPYESYEKLKDLKVEGFTEDQLDLFKIEKIYESQRRIDANKCYLNWYDLENYLYKMLDTLIPFEIRQKEPYTVFIERNTDINAHALGNGFIYVNIGLLAYQRDEAGFAAVLAHEIAHSYFNHGYTTNVDLYKAYNSNNISATSYHYMLSFEKYRKSELQADSFAYACLARAGYDLKSASLVFNSIDFIESNSMYYVNKTHRDAFTNYQSLFSSHPSGKERVEYVKSSIKRQSGIKRKFIIDSVFFCKIKKTASEEVKKINFEEGDYVECLRPAFAEYLTGNSSPKNLYFLFESLRRLLYRDPSMGKKGFLGEDLQFSEFENSNYSVLKLPRMLFVDSLQYISCLSHPLVADDNKPFNTYLQAYEYFTDLGEAKGFNEAIFSKALFHYSRKEVEPFNDNLNKYLEKGGGLFTDFATNLKENGYPKPGGGKITVLIDNASRYSGNDNYYQAIVRRQLYNKDIKEVFAKDSAKINLVMINELIGAKPRLLNTYQKLKWNTAALYNEADRERFEIIRVNKRETMDERALRSRYNKHLMIYIPEWYNWAKENNVWGVCILNVEYDYRQMRAPEEYHNYYQLSYCSFSDDKPYFKKCFRNGNVRKQTHKEIATDVSNFLFKKE